MEEGGVRANVRFCVDAYVPDHGAAATFSALNNISTLGEIGDMMMGEPKGMITGKPSTKLRYIVNHSGEFCVIARDLLIGDNVKIENFVEIQEGVKIGAGAIIRSFCRIGKDCVIGDRTVLKCAAITGPNTVIEEDCFIGPQVIFLSDLRTGKTGSIAKKGSFIGAGTLIMPNTIIGEGAFVGALSVVNRDCEPEKAYVGAPIRELEESAEVILKRLFEVGSQTITNNE